MSGYSLALNAVNPLLWDRLPFPALLRLITAAWSQQQAEKAYRVYMSDAIMTLTETVAKYFGGKYIGHRYIDYIDPPKPEKPRSGEEIIEDVRATIAAIGGDRT